MNSPKAVAVGQYLISDDHPAFIVAELGINHNGNISIAKELILAAATAGANAVKFQKRTPELCVPMDQRLIQRETPWGLMTYMDYRYRMEFERIQYLELMNFAKELNLEFFATPWDEESLEFLINIGVPCIKIASASLTDLNLISESAEYGLPVIISTVMSTMENIVSATKILEGKQYIVAHSTSTYPCPAEELNLSMINVLKKEFNCIVGYSGHERGVSTTVAAVVLGAKYIERHLTLDRAMWGSDHAASLEPQGFTRLVRDIRIFEQAIGNGVKQIYPSEIPYLEKLRRIK